jgi:hypothetical protein
MVVRTLAFMIVRGVLGGVGLGSTPDAKDIEIAVLRHQLMVVRRYDLVGSVICLLGVEADGDAWGRMARSQVARRPAGPTWLGEHVG